MASNCDRIVMKEQGDRLKSNDTRWSLFSDCQGKWQWLVIKDHLSITELTDNNKRRQIQLLFKVPSPQSPPTHVHRTAEQ